MVRVTSLAGCLVFAGCAGTTGPVCLQSATNEWLRQSPVMDSSSFSQLDASRVHIVSHDVPAAIALLASEGAVLIGPETVEQFTGRPRAETPAGTSAYLVRAVFPTSWPTVGVDLSGDDLHVFAGGLGCAPYRKNPLIVFLDRKPGEIFVMASSAW